MAYLGCTKVIEALEQTTTEQKPFLLPDNPYSKFDGRRRKRALVKIIGE